LALLAAADVDLTLDPAEDAMVITLLRSGEDGAGGEPGAGPGEGRTDR